MRSYLVGLTLGATACAGCADGEGRPHFTDAGGDASATIDGGAHVDAGARDAALDASVTHDVPVVAPTQCSPDLAYFEDEHGRQIYCVFVATSGDDARGDGTPTSPFRTIGHGIEVAVAQGVATGHVHAVAVSRGTYEERVVLANGVSVYGGFDADARWTRSASNVTTIESHVLTDGHIEAVLADGISAPTLLERFTIQASPGPGTPAGTDVYGVRVASSTPVLPMLGGLSLRDLVVVSGPGTAGAAGTPGAPGDDGEIGGTGPSGSSASGDAVPGGVGSLSMCDAVPVPLTRGGEGGTGGGDGAMGCGTYREDASGGLAPSGLASCAGGAAGDACSCVSPIDYEGASGGEGHSCASGPASAGSSAMASPMRGSVVGSLWQAVSAEGGSPGTHGIGGSGGGGGGAGCNAGGWGPTGGGGGGGGSGGCGGHGGSGGGAGGSSFALFAVDATLELVDTMLVSGTGGAGGAGGEGGPGGMGGMGGPGGPGGYAGGPGGRGQDGGRGGAGAGGPGGSSAAVLSCRASLEGLDLASLTEGTAGLGGAAATSGVEGVAGTATRVVDACAL